MFLRSANKCHRVAKKASAQKIKKMHQIKADSLKTMKERYPHALISTELHGKVAYMVRNESPDEIIESGGFHAFHKNIWLGKEIGEPLSACNNEGSVCLTLLPEISTIFLLNKLSAEKKPYFIYALPLEADVVLLGGQWRQVVVPGAMPLPDFWRAREVLKKINTEKVILGPAIGQGDDSLIQQSGERYDHYRHSAEMKMPQDMSLSEDYPAVYDVQDTKMTEAFTQRVYSHYQAVVSSNKHGMTEL